MQGDQRRVMRAAESDDITCRRVGGRCPRGPVTSGETTMIWMFLLAVVLGAVFFKLGVYSVVLGLVGVVTKVLFVVSGAFLVVAAGRWVMRRRRTALVRFGSGRRAA
jgi:hypothetical protein